MQSETMKIFLAPLSLLALTTLLGSTETAALIVFLDKGVDKSSRSLERTGVVVVVLGVSETDIIILLLLMF